MRTTIDLPDDLHEIARRLAHEQRRSMSTVVVELIRRGLEGGRRPVARVGRGVPVVSVGRLITSEDVRSLDDDE